ncbi:winged helix-turn-helix transcriptional regulator [Candidatus Bathyarchaeota archaeon]|nr:winged helix-turn-helix transcriptional regulator [Candidatus Bathyarchaeota archaeon]
MYFKANILKALADPIRLDIIELFRAGEWCVCDIVPQIKVAQPLVSRHLKILKERGIVKSRKMGNRTYYSITDNRIYDILDALNEELLVSFSDAIAQYSNIHRLRGNLV